MASHKAQPQTSIPGNGIPCALLLVAFPWPWQSARCSRKGQWKDCRRPLATLLLCTPSHGPRHLMKDHGIGSSELTWLKQGSLLAGPSSVVSRIQLLISSGDFQDGNLPHPPGHPLVDHFRQVIRCRRKCFLAFPTATCAFSFWGSWIKHSIAWRWLDMSMRISIMTDLYSASLNSRRHGWRLHRPPVFLLGRHFLGVPLRFPQFSFSTHGRMVEK